MLREKTIKRLDNFISYIGLILFSIFALNPIIQFFYKIWGGNNPWYPLREFYNYFVLAIGLIVFTFYLIYRWLNDSDVGIFKVQIKNIAFIFFILFALLMIVSTFYNRFGVILKTGFKNVAMIGTEYRNEGLLTYLSYLMYFLFAAFITDEKMKMTWLKCFAIVSSIPSIIVIIDRFFPSLGWDMLNSLLLFNNKNHLAYYTLISTSVAAFLFISTNSISKKVLYSLFVFIGTYALAVNDSLGPIIGYITACVFGVIVYTLCEKKFKLYYLLPLIPLLISYFGEYFVSETRRERVSLEIGYMKDTFEATEEDINQNAADIPSSGVTRLKLWKFTLEYIKAYPWLGVSSDAVGSRMEYECLADRCHCEYMNYALAFGIPAMISYVAGIFTIYLRGLFNKFKLTESNKICLCAAFGYCVSAAVGNSMFYTAPLLFIMLGFGYFRRIK